MMCEVCNENEASIHYTEIVNGVRSEHHLCSECARKMNFNGYTNMSDKDFPFVKLLTGLLSSGKGISDNPMMHVCCPGCNMSFDEFSMVGKFGCPECYNVFGPLIDDNMKRIHGDSTHRGKIYKGVNISSEEENTSPKKDKSKLLLEYSDQLKVAIELENYEEAAKLRDLIKELKKDE